MSWPLWAVLLSAAPIVLLATLLLRSQPLTRTAWVSALVSLALGLTVFGLDLAAAGVAVLRGLWTGSWILLIVLPALLLYEVLDRSGALDHLADAAAELAPTEGRRLLLLAWVLPSFLQGAAGFGAPIAMAAPMLVRRGMAPVAAVAACLIGYQWSVTFGSMGSSYFMAEATARLSEPDAGSFALRTSLVLAATALLSGWLVLRRGRRSPGDAWRLVAIGLVMAATLVAVVAVQPALGSTAAGLVGLLACIWLLPDRSTERPGGRDLGLAALPYVVLTATAAVGLAVPAVRSILGAVPEIAPVLPGSTAAFGFETATAPATPVLRPLLHPLPYLLFAVLVAVIAYRHRGWWPIGTGRATAVSWLQRCRRVGASILGLTVLASALADAGMIAAIADGLATGLGTGFVLASAPLGALGTMLTGSTTASNALFSSLQAQVGVALALAPAVLLSDQTAGGNIGNALSPGIAAVGTAAAGATGREGEVLRRNLGSAAALLVVVIASLVIQATVLG
ncbi:MAG: L-lactate permease [Nitriliruptoraceae bacterium]